MLGGLVILREDAIVIKNAANSSGPGWLARYLYPSEEIR